MARAATAKKKPARMSKAKPASTFGQRFVRWCFRPTRLLLAAAVTLAWLFWPRMEHQLPSLGTREEYRIGVEQVQVTPPPRWVPEDIVQKVFARAGFDQNLSILDPELSEKIALAFYTHPWIERLQQVRKAYPARVYVDVVYREPVAMVEVVGGGYYPIDRYAHLLPNEDFSAGDINRYPVIRNISSVPIGNLGEAWGDPAVAGAAQLAAILTTPSENGRSWWNALELKSIIAPRRMAAADEIEDLQYRIGTKGGSQIVWGRAPGTQHPSELTVVQKLGRMAEYHHSYNGFDDSPAPFVIDIRHWQGTRRSLLASEEAASSRQ